MTSRDGRAPTGVEVEFGSVETSHEYVAQLLRVVEETASRRRLGDLRALRQILDGEGKVMPVSA